MKLTARLVLFAKKRNVEALFRLAGGHPRSYQETLPHAKTGN